VAGLVITILVISSVSDSAGVITARVRRLPTTTAPVITSVGSVALALTSVIFKLNANAAYDDYRRATVSTDAEEQRRLTERFDKASFWTAVGAGGMAAASLALWVRYGALKAGYGDEVTIRCRSDLGVACIGVYHRF